MRSCTMKALSGLLAMNLLSIRLAAARDVFAHFMVGNTGSYGSSDWNTDMTAAQAAHIDAFALNMAADDSTNAAQIPTAFSVAEDLNFKLFFSFDYAGNGPWVASDVESMINQYKGSTAYFYYNSTPFVSTFEGPANSDDWKGIKTNTGCFFIPDWSSLGAEAAWALGTADGLFSWAAWPYGSSNMTTYTDASYFQFIGSAPYMMPVSPWFFTNLPGYHKNWLWRGDALWYDRWMEVLAIERDKMPEFLEIISWNDYGESHYIGPLNSKAYVAFESVAGYGYAPYNYAENMPHDAWRQFLPWYIDMYKTGTATVTQEILAVHYRASPKAACDTGGTSGNTASQYQIEFDPLSTVDDTIYVAALLASSATATVGGIAIEWDHIPTDGVGVYYGHADFSGAQSVVVAIERGASPIISLTGDVSISDSCQDDITNWNAFTAYQISDTSVSASQTTPLDSTVCTEGFGIGGTEDLCGFTCARGYCPVGACVCINYGTLDLPTPTGTACYPVATLNDNYDGLCAFAASYGYCPPDYCQETKVPVETPSVSPFSPFACTGGMINAGVSGDVEPLCEYACQHGFCPVSQCLCTATGVLDIAPTIDGYPAGPFEFGDDYDGLCNFTCSRTTCPSPVCDSLIGSSGSGSGDDFTTVVGGLTTTFSGIATVIDGLTETLAYTVLTNSAGLVYTSTITEGLTTVIGGITTTISGVLTVIGGETETLIPVVTTDAVGSIYTSIISEGPSPTGFITVIGGQTETITIATGVGGGLYTGTITGGNNPTSVTGLTTYSTFPPGLSWSTTSVTTNTHDGSGDPVLGPWPLCWFCPPGSNGIILSGLPPGVYPPGGPPSGLPTPFPPLTVESDGTPEYSTENQSCTKATVTDIYLSCDPLGQLCTTAASAVVTGCGATATTYSSNAACPVIEEPTDDLGPPANPGWTSTYTVPSTTVITTAASLCFSLGLGSACAKTTEASTTLVTSSSCKSLGDGGLCIKTTAT